MLEKGADKTSADGSGKTPYELAKSCGKVDAAGILKPDGGCPCLIM